MKTILASCALAIIYNFLYGRDRARAFLLPADNCPIVPITFIGVFVLIYVLAEYFIVGSNPGFSFLASALTIFNGVQLFALGIIAEYLACIFERTSGKQ